jgi:hypothetical protein
MGDRSKDMIPGLVRSLAPITPIKLSHLFIVCLCTQVLFGAIGLALAGLRGDLAERVAEPLFIIVVFMLVIGSAICATSAIRLAVPGRDDVPKGRLLGLVCIPFALALAIVAVAPWGGEWMGWRNVLKTCWSCIGVTAASAAVPWLATVILASRLAPLRERRVGLFAGLSAFLLGALVTQLHCPYGDSYHLALGHYLPIAVLSAATTWGAALLLRYRTRAA